MIEQLQNAPVDVMPHAPDIQPIVQLARDASIEINVQDVKHLEASRALLPPGKKIYVSHLPRQTWQATTATCRAVSEAGFDPVPHVPVRLLVSAEAFDQLLADFAREARIREILLVAGDYPAAAGPYSTTLDVLRGDLLQKHGFRRVAFAGHPEGHPSVPLETIRHAEREKALVAAQAGLEVTLLTQFFLEAAPFLDWVRELRANGVQARIVGGLAGPASAATLFKYALRCGVGPSIRALGTRPTSLMKLMGDHGPEKVLRELADARAAGTADFNGIHLFGFGGYLRTCQWLHRVANGQFTLQESGGF